mmetsp:Transcript_4513/g.5221  ORF Transcript_4513/g.5221 Transcript_4513/m.5221 type:complete len:372 (-) Transcript_4513:36-1151(-)
METKIFSLSKMTICILYVVTGGKAFNIFQRVSYTPCSSRLQLEFDGDEQENESGYIDEKRRFITKTPILITTSMIANAGKPLYAFAAEPVTAGEADGIGARLARKLRKKAPKVLRSKLNQDFAVLLMRSSYNALDKIDCVAMDQFQRDFFLIRQAEYQPYVNQLGPGIVQQGMLTDPNYFDFISFAQYTTISREINKNPPLVFEEQQSENVGEDQPQRFVSTLIKRDPLLTNEMLSKQHSKLVGTDIIDKLDEIFGGTPSEIPSVPIGTLDSKATLASLTQLKNLFLLNGFAFDGNVSITKVGPVEAEYCISLKNPATLWSGTALQQSRADPLNCFILKAATELVSRSGFVVSSSSVKYEENTEITYIRIK